MLIWGMMQRTVGNLGRISISQSLDTLRFHRVETGDIKVQRVCLGFSNVILIF